MCCAHGACSCGSSGGEACTKCNVGFFLDQKAGHSVCSPGLCYIVIHYRLLVDFFDTLARYHIATFVLQRLISLAPPLNHRVAMHCGVTLQQLAGRNLRQSIVSSVIPKRIAA